MERFKQKLQAAAIPFRENEPLAAHCTFKIGGPAQLFVMPENEQQLCSAVALCKEQAVRYYLLGNGSNILFADEGFSGVVIDVSALDAEIAVEDTVLTAGAGVRLAALCKAALKHGLSGLEFAYGIPGTVGGGVYEFVQERTDMEIAYVLSRRPRPELNCPVTSDFSRIVSDPTVDTAIEVMGGRQPAYEYMCAALRAGKNVVTANKQLMSERYGELVQLARENHVALRCSAAVGGGIRWLTNLESTLDMEPVLRVSGIMNGTTNYILDTMTTSGLKFEDALRQAQALGYAEVDPTEDLNGADARRKLVISTNVAFGCVVQEPEVTTFGIAGIRACDIGAARKMHRVVKLMASARLLDSGDVACYLEPAMMPQGMHEAAVPENFNLISITGMHIGKQSFYGQGAGRFPTAYNVMQDCLDIRNGLTRFYTDKLRPARVDNSSIMRPYYVRVNGMDRWLQTRIDKMLDCGIITTPVAVSEIHAWARERKLTETGGFLASLR